MPRARGRASIAAALMSLATALACARVSIGPERSAVAALPCRQVAPAPAPPVAWWSPPDDRARDELARWCETVGPILFLPNPAAATERPADRLAIVSWNVHVGGGDVDALVRALRAGDFTSGDRIDDFVLLLQEAYRRDAAIPARIARWYPIPNRIAARTGRGPDVAHVWRDAGLALLYAPSMRNGIVDADREDRGNAIASTRPLRDGTIVELPVERQRRVVAAAVVGGRTRAGASWTVRVVDVHLDTALALMHGGPFTARRRQAEALVSALSATAPPADRVTTVVAGDFNTVMGVREPAIGYLRQVFPDGPPPLRGPTFSGPLGFHATLDHVFVGGPVKSVDVQRLASRFGSDHYPLLTMISFR